MFGKSLGSTDNFCRVFFDNMTSSLSEGVTSAGILASWPWYSTFMAVEPEHLTAEPSTA